MHEQVYKKLQEGGAISWDGEKDVESLWSHQINRSLSFFLDQNKLAFKDLKIMDLGCGSGTCALFCAKEGACSLGVDISRTAIEMANDNNDLLNLNVRFMEADILTLDLNEKFDLITDSSVLHCLVGKVDRSQFFQMVKNHLSDSGYFFMHTMTKSSDMSSIEKDYFYFQDDVLYSLGIADIEEGRLHLEGKSYFPHRTILSLESLKEELAEAHFRIIHSKIISEKGVPDNFIALLQVK